MVNRADFLSAFFFDHIGQRDAHLVIVSGSKRIFELVERLIHFAGGGDREEVDHVLFELNGHRGQILRGSEVAHHHENLVLVDQFLCCQHRFFRIVARVFNQKFDLAAVDSAGFVDLINRQHHPQAGLFTKPSQWAG